MAYQVRMDVWGGGTLEHGMFGFLSPQTQPPMRNTAICNRHDCPGRPLCPQAHNIAELQATAIQPQMESLNWFSVSDRPVANRIHSLLLQSNRDSSSILRKHVDGIEMYLDKKASLITDKKQEPLCWTFTITAKVCVEAITMLDNETSANFSVQSITRQITGSDQVEKLPVSWGILREWSYSGLDVRARMNQSFKVKVQFACNAYGVYRQRVVFSFGSSGYLCRELKVTVRQMEITNKAADLAITESQRWESLPNVQIIRSQQPAECEEDEQLQRAYSRPADIQQCIRAVEIEQKPTAVNCKQFYHSLLYIEETEQFHELSKMKLKGQVSFSKTYTTESLANSTTHYARPAELFGKLPLDGGLSEDTVQGRILLLNVNYLLITCETITSPEQVFECRILDHSKDGMIFKATSNFVESARIEPETFRRCQVQFVVNRLPFCEMHSALDQLEEASRFYPDSARLRTFETSSLWGHTAVDAPNPAVDPLNPKQRDGFDAMVGPTRTLPVLLIGPFGTGKTMTLAAAIFHLLDEQRNRILVCTHSNSAADLYIKDHIHPYLETHGRRLKVLRIYYKHRWSAAVHPIVKNYTLFDHVLQSFRDPTLDDLLDVKVVVITLASCYSLLRLQLPKGFFTHIMVDEAAQAKEVETIIPLVLASSDTTVIMAGDHMQINPDVFSKYAKKYGLHRSILERLAGSYPDRLDCKVTLDVNYRSHEALVKYSSDIFYNGVLKAKGAQPAHPRMHPLSFIAARGESMQHHNGTGYYNLAEVYETVDFVTDLLDNWPVELWGEFDADSIGIILPYMDQVTYLRNLLKERSALREISVEKVSNVQGKQFRVVIINAVRTYHTCNGVDENETDFGFLSNSKLLNTAITRAQSLVTIVGDPFSLVTVGSCRNLWIQFLEQCDCNRSLHGVTFAQLQDYLDYIDIEKAFKLDPRAPEFVPSNRERRLFTAPPNLNDADYSARAYLPSSVYSPNPQHIPVREGIHPGVLSPPESPYPQVPTTSAASNLTSLPLSPPYLQLARDHNSAMSSQVPQHNMQRQNRVPDNTASSQDAGARSRTPLMAPLNPPADYFADLRSSWRKHTT